MSCQSREDALLYAAYGIAGFGHIPPQVSGCQFSSYEFQKRLTEAGLAASMNSRGNCYDNVFQESFWASLEAECFGKFIPETKQQANLMIFD